MDEKHTLDFGVDSANYPHEYSSDIVATVATEIEDSLKNIYGFDQISCVNVLYSNPRWRAMLHFIPLKVEGRTVLRGINDSLYEKFKQLKIENMPSDSEIDLLVDFAVRYPRTYMALKKLMKEPIFLDNLLRLTKEKTLRDKIQIDVPVLETDVLRMLLDEFRKPDSLIVTTYGGHSDVLQEIIHIMLSCIPQFYCSYGMMNNYRNGNVSDPEPRESDRVDWISDKDKIDNWTILRDSLENRGKPANRLYFLLSAIEAIQWPCASHFGIIHNLYYFLSHKLGGKRIEKWIPPLKRLSIYFNVTATSHALRKLKSGDQDREAKEIELAESIYKLIPRLVDLVHEIGLELYQADLDSYHELRSIGPASVTQGLLNIYAPDNVGYQTRVAVPQILKNGERAVTTIWKEWTNDSLYNKYEDEKPSPLYVDILRSPWGVYRDTIKGISAFEDSVQNPTRQTFYDSRENEGCLYEIEDKDVIGGIFFGSTPNTLEAYIKASSFRGRFLRALVTAAKRIPIGYDPQWYLKAFGELYLCVDNVRQHGKEETHAPEDFNAREKYEPIFYDTIIKNNYAHEDRPIDLLDIGIGYGRLETQLANISNLKLNVLGLDISAYMVDIASKSGIAKEIRLGEMRYVDKIYNDKKVDVVVLAYTTFGCYNNKKADHQTLGAIGRVLRPGGLLIIEQYCRKSYKYEPWICQIDEQRKDRNKQSADKVDRLGQMTLIKTAELFLASVDYSIYRGEYLYFYPSVRGGWLFRRDSYSLHLYTKKWFEETLEGMEFEKPNFYWDWGTNPDANANPDDHSIMICVARKKGNAVLSDDEYKKLIKVGWDIILSVKDLDIKDGCQELAKKLYSHNNEVYTKQFDKLVSRAKTASPTEGDFRAVTGEDMLSKFSKSNEDTKKTSTKEIFMVLKILERIFGERKNK